MKTLSSSITYPLMIIALSCTVLGVTCLPASAQPPVPGGQDLSHPQNTQEQDDRGEPAFCSRTSIAALKACNFQVQDDFWIAIGNCNNLSSAKDRQTCKSTATEEQQTAREECVTKFNARQEVCDAIGQAPYDPVIDPNNFRGKDSIVGNKYFPLSLGTTYVYKGGGQIDTVTVTNETKEILGVTTLVIKDVVTDEKSSEVIEKTEDWYAQDLEGNVWYFGEIAQQFDKGELVGIDGSWKAGVNSAKPGILMKVMPQVGNEYRQEFALGEAEDMAKVQKLDGIATVPAAKCEGNCLVTLEFSALEPSAMENKYYAPNVGPILVVDLETGVREELIEIK